MPRASWRGFLRPQFVHMDYGEAIEVLERSNEKFEFSAGLVQLRCRCLDHRARPGVAIRCHWPAAADHTGNDSHSHLVRRHAEHALVDIRRQSHELRRHRRQHHRSRETPVHGVCAGLCERLVRHPVHPAVRSGRHDRRLVVTNVFNERFWIAAADSGADANWQRWSMFTVDVRNQPGAADTRLVLPPTLAKIQRGGPVEDVLLVRDEVANMVWGIETTIRSQSRGTRGGSSQPRLSSCPSR
jgi:hypothetical protein